MSDITRALGLYEAVRDRLRSEVAEIDETTLADTVEGLTDLHEVIAAVVRDALYSEALATGLRDRAKEMQERLRRLEERAANRRLIARDAMLQAEIKKLTAPDFTVWLRPGPSVIELLDEKLISHAYWEPQPARLKKQDLLADLKRGQAIPGARLSDAGSVLSVRRT